VPSFAKKNLLRRLRDVDEIVTAHFVLTGGHRGRPALRQGAALTRAGVVLLAAAMEAFVEDLFEESARLLMPTRTADELNQLFENTSKRLNVADVHKTNLLYFNLGIQWVLERIRWQKFSNKSFQKTLNKLVETRNQIAHGSQPGVRLQSLRKWRGFVLRYSQKLEEAMSARIRSVTGSPPAW
jgi:hypothetical protein